MKRRDLERRLRIAGCYLKRQGKSHSLQNDRILDDLKRKTAVRLKLCYLLLVAGGAAFLITFTMAQGIGSISP